MRRFWAFVTGAVFVVLSFLAAAEPALAERRLAFVVGIDAYARLGSDAQLQRAAEDAGDIGHRLSALGFIVTTLGRDVTVSQDLFLKRFSSWTSDIQPGDIALFYFVGHGVGINGNNYLIPADMPNLVYADELLFRAHAIKEIDIRDRILARGASVTVLVLDACRNNPFNTADRAMASFRGLLPVGPAKGVLTIYAAGYGQTALDRLSDADPNPNSVFTRVVIAELQKPAINVVNFSEDVRERVAALARSVGHDQVPAVDNQLQGGRPIDLAGAPPGAQSDSDEVAWHAVQSTRDIGALRSFVADFPQSQHRQEAEARIATLDRPMGAAPAEPLTPDSSPPVPRSKPDAAQDRTARGNQPEADEIVWEALAGSDRPQALKDFIRAFPGSALLPQAKARIRALDDSAWAKAANADLAGVARYLYDFPEGVHRDEANARLSLLETPPGTSPVAPAPVAPAPVAPAQVSRVPSHGFRARKVAHVRQRVAAYVKPRVNVVRAPPKASGGNCFSFAGERHCQ